MNTDIPKNAENIIVDTHWVGECHIVTFKEKSFTIHNAPRILKMMQGKLIPNTNTLLVLNSVEQMDSSACGCILHLHRLCKSMGCELAIVCNENVKNILFRLHFQRLMQIFPKIDDATKVLGKSSGKAQKQG